MYAPTSAPGAWSRGSGRQWARCLVRSAKTKSCLCLVALAATVSPLSSEKRPIFITVHAKIYIVLARDPCRGDGRDDGIVTGATPRPPTRATRGTAASRWTATANGQSAPSFPRSHRLATSCPLSAPILIFGCPLDCSRTTE